MSGGQIGRHNCGRLILFGQTCVCQPPRTVVKDSCDCKGHGNTETTGAHCTAMRRAAWDRAINGRRSP